LTTVVMFVLVPQVKLSKRLNVARPIPQMIVYSHPSSLELIKLLVVESSKLPSGPASAEV
jgi:hypothetical protein